MNFSLSNIIAGVLFGIFGLFVFRSGKERADVPAILLGIALMLFPYLVENSYLVWGIGLVLSFLAYKRL